MSRKIIQIACCQSQRDVDEIDHNLYALCDDGSVWEYEPRHIRKRYCKENGQIKETVVASTWSPFPPIPDYDP